MQNPSLRLLLLLLLAMVFWGGGWPALKILTESVDVVVVTFWRMLIMCLSFLPILYVYGKPLRITRRSLGYVSASAALNVLFMFLAFFGVHYGMAGSGGVIVTTLSPLLTLALLYALRERESSPTHLTGLLLGMAGGFIMLEPWHTGSAALLQSGNLYFLLAALTWAFITLLSQRSHLHIDPLHFTFLLSVIATALLFVLALPYDLSVIFAQDARFWTSMLYLTLCGQTIASTIYFYASGKLGSGRTSSFMFLVPVAALASSWLILGEVPSPAVVFGGAMSALAVYLINRKRVRT